MVVEDMASMPARNMPFMLDHPNRRDTEMPIIIIEKTMVRAAIIGASPIFRIFLNEKSKPNVKRRNITPILPHISMFS